MRSAGCGLGDATRRLDKVWSQLWSFSKSALRKQAVASLLRSYAELVNITFRLTCKWTSKCSNVMPCL